MPGIIWLILLFLVPFYVVLAIAGGELNAIFQTPVPVWNPLHWTGATYAAVYHDLSARVPSSARSSSGPCSTWPSPRSSRWSIAYPAAYFVARYAGRRKVSSWPS